MLRRLRYELYDRILRFPPAHFRKVKQAELATMIKDEVEPLGGFIGDAFVQPMFLGGQALTAIIFIMMQNWLLSIIVIVLLAVQMSIIPRLRRPVLALGRQRQMTARLLAGRIAETADGVNEIHIHGAANYERADISERLGHIFRIRFELYNKKFVAKFWNNLLSQATPFAIYLVGGYFAITGQMDVGAVVGVLLAYKDLPSPIKELIDREAVEQVDVKAAEEVREAEIDRAPLDYRGVLEGVARDAVVDDRLRDGQGQEVKNLRQHHEAQDDKLLGPAVSPDVGEQISLHLTPVHSGLPI
jgi:putative ABC transport system ATP-binding protein